MIRILPVEFHIQNGNDVLQRVRDNGKLAPWYCVIGYGDLYDPNRQ
jgi:hypothetical protein